MLTFDYGSPYFWDKVVLTEFISGCRMVKNWKSYRCRKVCHCAQLIMPSFYNCALYTALFHTLKLFSATCKGKKIIGIWLFLKFRFFKKVTKTDEISTLDLMFTIYISSNLRWRFRQFLWSSRKTWTLTLQLQECSRSVLD